MSYDLYCYRPSTDVPDLSEAEALVEAITEAEESGIAREPESSTRDAVVAALLKHNPRLEKFHFDHAEIASDLKISESEARARFQYAELNPPEGDRAIQLTVHADHVFISIPYWYQSDAVDAVIEELSGYLRVIRETAGYFVYDPQMSAVFDPRQSGFEGRATYLRVTEGTAQAAARGDKESKPWWRFW
jgi:hypothetical protein